MKAMKLVATVLIFVVLYQEGSADHAATHVRAAHRAQVVASDRGRLRRQFPALGSVKETSEDESEEKSEEAPEETSEETSDDVPEETPEDTSGDSASPSPTMLQSPEGNASASLALAPSTGGASAETSTNAIKKSGKRAPSLPRPTDGGEPDFVEFFMFCKNFYGADVSKGTFTIDLVLSYTWSDPRVADLVPDGQKNVNLPVDIGSDKMWSPKIVITSKDFSGTEVLSDFLQASENGKVIRVTRMLYTGRQAYDVSQFPFDSQNLSILITSGSAMMEEVKLKPKPNSSHLAVAPTALENKPFVLESTDQWEFEEVSGPLRKSRGRFDMKVQRKAASPLRAFGYPQVLLLLQGYSVFFLPLAAFSVMPRVATGLISFLALMSVQSGQAATVPAPGDASFMGLLNGVMMQLVTAAVILNVFIHFVAFVWKDEGFAQQVNDECRISFALCSVISLILVAAGSFGVLLGILSFTSQFGIWVYNIGYMWWCARRHAEKCLQTTQKQEQK